MAINFPLNPTKDQEHLSSGITWICTQAKSAGDTYDSWGRKKVEPTLGLSTTYVTESQPSDPIEGDGWYVPSSNILMLYEGGAFKDVSVKESVDASIIDDGYF